MSDDWRRIEGFPRYSVNSQGEVRHEPNQRPLIPRYNEYGVPYVGLMKDWKQHIRSLPRLVAYTFVSPPSDIFNTPIQLDGNSANCRADNLMWRPRWYAVKYKRQFREPYHRPIKQPVHAVGKGENFPNSFEAALRYGLLEEEVVLSIENNTPAWPTYQEFKILEMA